MTIAKSPAVDAGIMPDYTKAGVVLCRTLNWTLDEQLKSTQTLQLLPVPKDAILLDFSFMISLAGTHETENNIGWGTECTQIIDGVPFTGASLKRMNHNTNSANSTGGFLHKFTADDTIDWIPLKLNTKLVTNTYRIRCAVWYKMAGTISDELDCPGT